MNIHDPNVTLPKVTTGALPASRKVYSQPEAAPKPVGWLIPEPVTENPVGVVQVLVGLVQAKAEKDFTTVPVVGTVKLNV